MKSKEPAQLPNQGGFKNLHNRSHRRQSAHFSSIIGVLVGVTIAPTFFIFESIVVLPAVIMLRAVFDGGKDALWCFFVFGVLPILCTGGMIFALWSVIIWRRQRRSATPQP